MPAKREKNKGWRERFLRDLRRIDAMVRAIYPDAIKGNVECINTVIVLRRERESIQREFGRQSSLELLSAPNIVPESADVGSTISERPRKDRKLRAKTRRAK